jgi:hypothetical protein
MATTIQHRRATAANWTSTNSILAAAEIGVESDTLLFKIGDGVTAWNSLAYAGGGGGGTWGSITGTLSAQTDLQAELDAKVPTTRTVNTHALSSDVTVTKSDVGLGNVTNDIQTKAAVVPNTAPSAGQLLVGNAGGTAYAPVSASGDVTAASTGAVTIANDAVTYAKIQNVSAASRLLGRGADAGAGNVEELTIGDGLRTAGTELRIIESGQAFYSFDNSTTMADPGTGDLRINNAVWASATEMALSDTTDAGTDISQILNTVAEGDTIYVQDRDNAANYARYMVATAPTDNTSWHLIPLTYVSAAGSAPSNNERLLIQINLGGGTTGGVSDFLALTDTPNSYSGQSLKHVQVNAGETALEFVTLGGGGDALTSNPLSQFASTTSSQLRGVLSDENGTGAFLCEAATTPSFTTGIRIGGAAASGKILKGDGTDFVPSTETYAAPGTSGNVMTSDGSNWTSAAPSAGGTTSTVTGSNFTTSSTSLVNITGLTFAASANKLYEVDALIKFQSSSTAGIRLSVAFSAAGATGEYSAMGNTNTTTAATDVNVFGTACATARATAANTDSFAHIKAAVTIAANAGNITIQILKATSGTATVYIGSRMTVTELA